MEIIQTKKGFAASKLPTLLDTERILSIRQLYYNNHFYLRNLEAGLAGEEKVLDFLNRYGKDDWKGVRNIWLNNNGKFECDLLLLANAGLHMFEIKHYKGQFVYDNGDCILNNKVLADNPITQSKRNFRKLKNIIQKLDPHLKVYGTLLFIGEHNSVEIKSPVSDINIVKPTELKEVIMKMVEADRYQTTNYNVNSLMAHLEKFEDTNYFVPKPLNAASMQKIRKGIYCGKCQNFQVTISKLYINCPCGYKESREIGILRTLYEYSVLTMRGRIVHREAMDFLNKGVSVKYLINIMSKHLVRVNKGKYTYYKIDPIPFHNTGKYSHIMK